MVTSYYLYFHNFSWRRLSIHHSINENNSLLKFTVVKLQPVQYDYINEKVEKGGRKS